MAPCNRSNHLFRLLSVLLLCAVCAGLFAGCSSPSPAETPVPASTPAVVPTVTPEPTVVPTPTPTPEPIPAFDFSLPAPESAPVEMDYFADAVFIGDSRTDGLRLFSGITGTTFHCYTGLTILEVQNKRFLDMDGEKLSVVEALGRRQYGKVYISLGVNELGFYDDPLFEKSFRTFLRQVKELQPNAIVYLQNLVPVNPDKCAANNQPYYVTNDQVAVYNQIFARLAVEEQVVLLDVATALTNEEGILARENTSDGVHYTKDWYKTWLAFLLNHTINPEEYWAGQTAVPELPLPTETPAPEGVAEHEA